MLKYRPFKSAFSDGVVVVCTDEYDLFDYEQWRFMHDKDGSMIGFDDEEECIKWINDNIKPELISKKYLRMPDDYYYKEDL